MRDLLEALRQEEQLALLPRTTASLSPGLRRSTRRCVRLAGVGTAVPCRASVLQPGQAQQRHAQQGLDVVVISSSDEDNEGDAQLLRAEKGARTSSGCTRAGAARQRQQPQSQQKQSQQPQRHQLHRPQQAARQQHQQCERGPQKPSEEQFSTLGQQAVVETQDRQQQLQGQQQQLALQPQQAPQLQQAQEGQLAPAQQVQEQQQRQLETLQSRQQQQQQEMRQRRQEQQQMQQQQVQQLPSQPSSRHTAERQLRLTEAQQRGEQPPPPSLPLAERQRQQVQQMDALLARCVAGGLLAATERDEFAFVFCRLMGAADRQRELRAFRAFEARDSLLYVAVGVRAVVQQELEAAHHRQEQGQP